MALITCKKCGNKISDKAKKCPFCICDETFPLSSLFRKYDSIMFFDVETTGLDPKEDYIIEFAALNVRYLDGKTFVCNEVDVFAKPAYGKQLSESTVQLTGITNDMIIQKGVTQSELFSIVDKSIKSYGKTVLVAHNAQFDMNYLKELYQKNNMMEFFEKLDVVDSLTICRDRFAYPHKLKNAIEFYSLTEYVQNTHRGIDDVYALYEVCKAIDKSEDDIDSYINIFGYNEKYSIIGDKLNRVKYLPQKMDGIGRIYEGVKTSMAPQKTTNNFNENADKMVNNATINLKELIEKYRRG